MSSGPGVMTIPVRGRARWAALTLALALPLPAAANAQNAYITNNGSNTVSVIDTAANSVTATIPVGSGPVGVAVAPDAANAYVTNQEGTVSRAILLPTIPVGNSPVAFGKFIGGPTHGSPPAATNESAIDQLHGVDRLTLRMPGGR